VLHPYIEGMKNAHFGLTHTMELIFQMCVFRKTLFRIMLQRLHHKSQR